MIYFMINKKQILFGLESLNLHAFCDVDFGFGEMCVVFDKDVPRLSQINVLQHVINSPWKVPQLDEQRTREIESEKHKVIKIFEKWQSNPTSRETRTFDDFLISVRNHLESWKITLIQGEKLAGPNSKDKIKILSIKSPSFPGMPWLMEEINRKKLPWIITKKDMFIDVVIADLEDEKSREDARQASSKDLKEDWWKLAWTVALQKSFTNWIDSLSDVLENSENPEFFLIACAIFAIKFPKVFWGLVLSDQLLATFWQWWILGVFNKNLGETQEDVIERVKNIYKLLGPWQNDVPTPESIVWLSRVMPKTGWEILTQMEEDWIWPKNPGFFKQLAINGMSRRPYGNIDEKNNLLFQSDKVVTNTQMYLGLYVLLEAMWKWNVEEADEDKKDGLGAVKAWMQVLENNRWKTLKQIAKDFIVAQKWVFETAADTVAQTITDFSYDDILTVRAAASSHCGKNYMTMKSGGTKYIIDSNWGIYNFDNLFTRTVWTIAWAVPRLVWELGAPDEVKKRAETIKTLADKCLYIKLVWPLNGLSDNKRDEVVEWLDADVGVAKAPASTTKAPKKRNASRVNSSNIEAVANAIKWLDDKSDVGSVLDAAVKKGASVTGWIAWSGGAEGTLSRTVEGNTANDAESYLDQLSAYLWFDNSEEDSSASVLNLLQTADKEKIKILFKDLQWISESAKKSVIYVFNSRVFYTLNEILTEIDNIIIEDLNWKLKKKGLDLAFCSPYEKFNRIEKKQILRLLSDNIDEIKRENKLRDVVMIINVMSEEYFNNTMKALREFIETGTRVISDAVVDKIFEKSTAEFNKMKSEYENRIILIESYKTGIDSTNKASLIGFFNKRYKAYIDFEENFSNKITDFEYTVQYFWDMHNLKSEKKLILKEMEALLNLKPNKDSKFLDKNVLKYSLSVIKTVMENIKNLDYDSVKSVKENAFIEQYGNWVDELPWLNSERPETYSGGQIDQSQTLKEIIKPNISFNDFISLKRDSVQQDILRVFFDLGMTMELDSSPAFDDLIGIIWKINNNNDNNIKLHKEFKKILKKVFEEKGENSSGTAGPLMTS